MEATKNAQTWNSLEVAKLLVSLFTSLAVVVMGGVIQREIATQDNAWKAQTRLADRRLAIYESARTDLNRIYCFIEDVGTWKEESPETIIKAKRQIDAVMYTNQAVWTPGTFAAYQAYMNSAFATYQGVGIDAKIKTSDAQKVHGIKGWSAQWSERLAPPDSSHQSRYAALNAAISADLMLTAPR